MNVKHGVDSLCIKVGVTAHRDLSCVDEANLEQQVRDFFTRLHAEFPGLPLVVLNSLAAGGDMLVARVALEMGLALEVPLPMPMEIYEQDFDSPELLAEFRGLCDRGTLIELPLVAGPGVEEIELTGDARNLQYSQLGMYIASHSAILLALWDGEESRGPGGTAAVVHFQLHDEMIGVSEPHDAAHLLADKESDLVYHIDCPRSDSVAAQSVGCWLSSTEKFPGPEFPESYRAAFLHMQDFRSDIRVNLMAIKESGDSLVTDPVMLQDPALQQIDSLFRCADWLAIRYRKLVVRELLLTHILAVLMGFCFILYSEYMEFSFLLPAFLLCFFTAWVLNKLANSRQWHRKYLDYRVLAEGLRVQFYWTLADVEGSGSTAFAYDNLMQKQDVELVWIRHVMRCVSSAGKINVSKIDDGLEMAILHWIGSETGSTGQLGYYRHASVNRTTKLQRNAFYGRLTLWCGISIAVLLLVVGNLLDDLSTNVLLIMMGMLPLIAGVREAYAYKKADKELTKQYQFMYKTFSRARQRTQQATNDDLKRLVLRALGEACLEEHSEWILIHRERPLEHSGLHA